MRLTPVRFGLDFKVTCQNDVEMARHLRGITPEAFADGLKEALDSARTRLETDFGPRYAEPQLRRDVDARENRPLSGEVALAYDALDRVEFGVSMDRVLNPLTPPVKIGIIQGLQAAKQWVVRQVGDRLETVDVTQDLMK